MYVQFWNLQFFLLNVYYTTSTNLMLITVNVLYLQSFIEPFINPEIYNSYKVAAQTAVHNTVRVFNHFLWKQWTWMFLTRYGATIISTSWTRSLFSWQSDFQGNHGYCTRMFRIKINARILKIRFFFSLMIHYLNVVWFVTILCSVFVIWVIEM